MGINFPSSPTEGQVFEFQITSDNKAFFTFTNGKWEVTPKRARPFNFITNGSFQVSQEFDVATTNVNGAFAADQWWFSTSLTANVQVQRIAFNSINNSKYRYRAHVWTAKASIAAAEYVIAPGMTIEGTRFSAFGWGTAYPKQALLRFWLYAPAGTYAVCIRNGGTVSRSYVIPIVVTAGMANTNTLWEFVIPPDTAAGGAGDWPNGNTSGCYISWVWAAGTQYLTSTTNAWVEGNFLGPTGMSNGLATLNNMFELQDVGFYIDHDNSGVFPPWEIVPENVALNESQRYWYISRRARGVSLAASGGRVGSIHPTEMRAAPSLAVVSNPTICDAGTLNATFTAVSPVANERSTEFNAAISAGTALTLGYGNVLVGISKFIQVSARM
jgi:hypothetical protein